MVEPNPTTEQLNGLLQRLDGLFQRDSQFMLSIARAVDPGLSSGGRLELLIQMFKLCDSELAVQQQFYTTPSPSQQLLLNIFTVQDHLFHINDLALIHIAENMPHGTTCDVKCLILHRLQRFFAETPFDDLLLLKRELMQIPMHSQREKLLALIATERFASMRQQMEESASDPLQDCQHAMATRIISRLDEKPLRYFVTRLGGLSEHVVRLFAQVLDAQLDLPLVKKKLNDPRDLFSQKRTRSAAATSAMKTNTNDGAMNSEGGEDGSGVDAGGENGKNELSNSGTLLGLLSDSGDSLSAFLLSRSASDYTNERERDAKIPRLSFSVNQERALLEGLRASASQGQSGHQFASSFIEFMNANRNEFSWNASDGVGLDVAMDDGEGMKGGAEQKPFSLSDLRLSFGQSHESSYTFDVEEFNQLLIEGKISIDGHALSLSQEFQAIRNKNLVVGNGENGNAESNANGNNSNNPTATNHNKNSSSNNNTNSNNVTSNNNSSNNNHSPSNNANGNARSASQKEEKPTHGRQPKRTYVKKVNGIPVKLDDNNQIIESDVIANVNASHPPSNPNYSALNATNASGFSSSFVSPTALGNFLYDPNNSSAPMNKNSNAVGKTVMTSSYSTAPISASVGNPITYSKLAGQSVGMMENTNMMSTYPTQQQLNQQQQPMTTSENLYVLVSISFFSFFLLFFLLHLLFCKVSLD
jgi:hypothetical protein